MFGKHEIFDFDNAGHSVFGVAKELHAHCACVIGHAMQNPARAGDQAVATFFLNAWQTCQKFVGDVLAQAFFAEDRTWNVQTLFSNQGGAIGFEIFQLETGHLHIVNLAKVVAKARDLKPLCIGRDHAPAGQVVEGCAPQHGFFTTRIHGDVAANAAGLSRRRVHGKHPAGALCGIGHALCDHAHFGPQGGYFFVEPR